MFPINGPGATEYNTFTNGDPVIPIQPTQVTAEWLNGVQEEILTVITSASLSPDKNNNAQLLAALKKLFPGMARKVNTTAPLTGGAALSGDLTLGINAASAATANYVILRDASGRAKVAAPAAADDIARKAEVDAAQAAAQTASVPVTRKINTTAPLTGAGSLSSDLTLAITPGYLRIPCTSDLNLYVRTDGNDANDGLANTAARAFKTITAAVNSLMRFDGRGYTADINIAAGTYAEGVYFDYTTAPSGFGRYILDGASSSTTIIAPPVNVIGIYSGRDILLTVKNLRINVASGGTGMHASYGGYLLTEACAINGLAGANTAFGAWSGGVLQGINGSFSGSFVRPVHLPNFGMIQIEGTWSVAGSASQAFAIVSNGGLLIVQNVTFTGSMSGKKYEIVAGIINSNGRGINFLPGNIAGESNAGGQYV